MVNPVRLIVGLGNPGDRYRDTRHNAGWWFVERLAQIHGTGFRRQLKQHACVARVTEGADEYRLAKNLTFMNHCGRTVQALAGYYHLSPEQILVAHDDLDLPVATVRIKCGGGHGGHNGLRDVIATLGDSDFVRLRIGIGHPGAAAGVSDYVLSRPDRADQQQLETAVDKALDIVPHLVRGALQTAMQILHSPP
jgi:peptidyl-tRNA hydrolase, PTH1 family